MESLDIKKTFINAFSLYFEPFFWLSRIKDFLSPKNKKEEETKQNYVSEVLIDFSDLKETHKHKREGFMLPEIRLIAQKTLDEKFSGHGFQKFSIIKVNDKAFKIEAKLRTDSPSVSNNSIEIIRVQPDGSILKSSTQRNRLSYWNYNIKYIIPYQIKSLFQDNKKDDFKVLLNYIEDALYKKYVYNDYSEKIDYICPKVSLRKHQEDVDDYTEEVD